MALTPEQKAAIVKEHAQGEGDTGSPEVQVALRRPVDARVALERLREPGLVMIEDPKLRWPAELEVGPDGIGNSQRYITHIMEESMEAMLALLAWSTASSWR